MENKNTDVNASVDYQKLLNEETLQTLERMKMKESNKSKELSNKDVELTNLINNISKSLTNFDEANKQYDEIMADTGVRKEFVLFLTHNFTFLLQGLELTPLELKIKNLERQIIEMEEKNAKLKSFWLREQTYIVSMTQERQKQIYELNLIRKRNSIIIQGVQKTH